MKAKTCTACPAGTYPGGGSDPVYKCQACPNGMIYDTALQPWSCVCDRVVYTQAGDLCMEKTISDQIAITYPETNAATINYNNELEVNFKH
jgi:hypothetical protein